MPNDYTVVVNVNYFNITSCIIINADIDSPDLNWNFNIYGKYFHQQIGLGSLNVSVSGSKADVSISPEWRYKTSSPIVFECKYIK